MSPWLQRLCERLFPQSLGARGERLAARYARQTLRYAILARNVRCPGGELDIIALDGKDLVFIEVRTRTSEDFGTPEASIGGHKRRFLTRSAQWYMRQRRVKGLVPRFDVIAIVWPPNAAPVIRHHRNAFPTGRR